MATSYPRTNSGVDKPQFAVSPEEQKRRDARRHEKALAESLAAVRGDREALKKLKRY